MDFLSSIRQELGKNEHLAKIGKEIEKNPHLDMLEKKLNMDKHIIAAGAAFLFILLVFFGIGMGLVCNLIAMVYPAYHSLLCIERFKKENTPGSPVHRNDKEHWLSYWVIFGIITVFEAFLETILYMVPFYFAFKGAFMVWCMHPTWRGSSFIYTICIRESFKQPEPIAKK